MPSSTIAATTKACAHPGCACEVTATYPYCSPECASTAKVATTEAATCPCDHRACKSPKADATV
jgi:hypothetical protein